MGTKELLFIALGAIIVSVAIAVGISLYNQPAVQDNRDRIILDLNNFGADAQIYYKRTPSLGGGGGSYSGWDISPSLKTSGNQNGIYKTKVKAQKVTITGTGKEIGENGDSNIKIRMVVVPNKLELKTLN